MSERNRQLTIRATAEQISRWKGAAEWAVKGRDVRRFVAIGADFLARRLRETLRQREKPDPIAIRLHEKVLLGRLLEAARNAVDYLPKEVNNYTRGRLYPKKDLQRAIEDVKRFLAETGEEYGPCP